MTDPRHKLCSGCHAIASINVTRRPVAEWGMLQELRAIRVGEVCDRCGFLRRYVPCGPEMFDEKWRDALLGVPV